MSSVACYILLGAVSLSMVGSGNLHSTLINNVTKYECKEVPSELCADHFGVESWYGRFPNTKGLDLDDSIVEFFHFFARFSTKIITVHTCSSMSSASITFRCALQSVRISE